MPEERFTSFEREIGGLMDRELVDVALFKRLIGELEGFELVMQTSIEALEREAAELKQESKVRARQTMALNAQLLQDLEDCSLNASQRLTVE